MAKHQDLTGMVFGRLTVLREAGRKKPGVYLWECECSCENHTHVIVDGASLTNCPENCKWATWKEQQNNKRNNKYLEYKGKTQTLAQWCEELGLDYSRTKARINVCGWTVEEAFEREKYAQVNLGK